jgi:two-component system response regulator QseB
MRILLVEDDHLLADSLAQALKADGYFVDWLGDGKLAASLLRIEKFDLVILDQRLPGFSGLELLRQMRAHSNTTPVLLLTACDAIEDKVAGLDAGADDYLTKPFDMDELFARARSLLRRSSTQAPLLHADGVVFDPASRSVAVDDTEVTDLTKKELAILESLLRSRGRFVTKNRLLESSSSLAEEPESNTIEVYISRLRKRIGRDRIETLRGVGYRIK